MAWSEPATETTNVTEARRLWSSLLNRVFRREARVVVEKNGIPVAAVISYQEYEFFLSMKAKRAERLKIIDDMREAFKDVPPEEIEREVAKANAEVRAGSFTALDQSQAAFRGIPDEELEREVDRAVMAARLAHRQAAQNVG